MPDRRMRVNFMQVILPSYVSDLNICTFWYVRGILEQLPHENLKRGEKGGRERMGEMDTWMDRWTDRPVDGWMDG